MLNPRDRFNSNFSNIHQHPNDQEFRESRELQEVAPSRGSRLRVAESEELTTNFASEFTTGFRVNG
jgi:hypothetical protein